MNIKRTLTAAVTGITLAAASYSVLVPEVQAAEVQAKHDPQQPEVETQALTAIFLVPLIFPMQRDYIKPVFTGAEEPKPADPELFNEQSLHLLD